MSPILSAEPSYKQKPCYFSITVMSVFTSSGTSVCTSFPTVAPHDLKGKTLKLLYITDIKVINILVSPGSILLYCEEGSYVEFSHANLTGLGRWSGALSCFRTASANPKQILLGL